MPSKDVAVPITLDIPYPSQNHEHVRGLIINNEPWFLLSDLCRVLGLKNVTQTSARLDDSEYTQLSVLTSGGPQMSTLVNEFGLYELAMTSRVPEAKRFRQWAKVVFRKIHKTGAYLTDKLSDEIAAVLLTQDRCTDQALVALDQGRPAEAAARLRQAREAQGKLNELIDREPLPITRGVADPVRSPELRKALGLGKHRPQDVVAGYADDVVNEPREYRYPAQYAR